MGLRALPVTVDGGPAGLRIIGLGFANPFLNPFLGRRSEEFGTSLGVMVDYVGRLDSILLCIGGRRANPVDIPCISNRPDLHHVSPKRWSLEFISE